MKKLAVVAALVAVGLVTPAQAYKPDKAARADAPAKATKPAKTKAEGRGKGRATRCAPRSVGFNATGTLLTSTLIAGEAGRYSGTISVHVTRANHGAPMGDQTYTLANARVRFRAGVDAAAPAAGSLVRIGGKITKLTRKCPTAGFEPAATVKRVEVKAAKMVGADEAETADADAAETADADEAKKADA